MHFDDESVQFPAQLHFRPLKKSLVVFVNISVLELTITIVYLVYGLGLFNEHNTTAYQF